MSKDRFEFILELIRSEITGQDTNLKKCIIAKEKLVVTLKFLASGSTFVELIQRYRLGKSTVRKIIIESVNAIILKMMPITMRKLKRKDWKCISEEFMKKWNFPNCVGATDGKHVSLFCPANSGSKNFNYKKQFSINLMAVVDASYKFIMVDVGAAGSNHDATVFWNSDFGKMWYNQNPNLYLPQAECLPQTQDYVPFQLIADDAFGLSTTVLNPYSGNDLTRNNGFLIID